jgi:hypothetical protein
MGNNSMSVGLIVVLATMFANNSSGEEPKFDLPVMGGFAVSADNSTLVVALTAKTELLFIDTLTSKEAKRLKVEFQPAQMAWGDKVLFVAQKGAGLVHVLDVNTGKELGTGKLATPIKNLIVVKGVCFASTGNREMGVIDATGTTTQLTEKGAFIAADPKGEFLYACIEGKATTDINKYKLDGVKLTKTDISSFFRRLRASLIKVQAIGISADGKQFGVVAQSGWADLDKKRHFSAPFYSTEDMKSQLGEMETGQFPCGMAVHPVLPLMFACSGKEGTVYNAKSYAPGQKFTAPLETKGDEMPSVLAFVGKGQKLAWGVSGPDAGVLKLYDLQLTAEQKAEVTKAFSGK